jgi:hypothetical protein
MNNWFTRSLVAITCALVFQFAGALSDVMDWYIEIPIIILGFFIMDLYARMENKK